MSDFLNSKGYRLVWTVQGEKNIQGDWRRDENWPGRMEISGYMRMKDGQVFGEANAYWNTAGSDPEIIRTISIQG